MSRSFLVVNNGRSFKAKPRTRGFTVFPTARQFTIEGSTPIMNFKSAKDPGETRLITLMFTGDLVSGETLTGTPTVVVVDLVTGETITGMAANTPVISQNGTGVSFLLSGGILGQSYSLTATCSTSTGEVISEGAILSIQLAAFMN